MQAMEAVCAREGRDRSWPWEPLVLPASVSQLVPSTAVVADSPNTSFPHPPHP